MKSKIMKILIAVFVIIGLFQVLYIVKTIIAHNDAMIMGLEALREQHVIDSNIIKELEGSNEELKLKIEALEEEISEIK